MESNLLVGRGAALALLVALAGCGPEAEPAPPAEFIALPRDFQDFRAWPSFEVSDGLGGDGHGRVDRTVYVSAALAEGGEGFAVGTIFLKTGVNPARQDQLHGMVKRGGGYNQDGAQGWEWFEFDFSDDGQLVPRWRGEDAPAGECYGTLPGEPCDVATSSCNQCHAGSAANDFVHSRPLQLDGIDESLLR